MQPDTAAATTEHTSEQRARGARHHHVFEAVTMFAGLAIAGVVGYALWRQFSSPGEPVLPTVWCRAGSSHDLPPLMSSAAFTRWTLDGIALAVLGFMGALYLAGVALARRNGVAWSLHRTASFLAGLGVAALATCSSVAVYDMVLFSAHMIGHLMLVMVAPALMAGGRPLTLLLAATRSPWHERIERFIHGPVLGVLTSAPVALACYTAAIVGTHLTGLMDTIMTSAWAGQAEHLVYLVVGLLFFTVVLGDEPTRWHLTTAARWLLLGVAMAVDTFVGVVLIMSNTPVAMTQVPGFSVDPLADTRTAGAIMWVGGDGIMVLVMILLVRQWLVDPQRRREDRMGFAERARQNVFAEHIGGPGAVPVDEADPDFDDNDTRLAEYNRWLSKLNDD